MKIRKREKLPHPVPAEVGDSLVLYYDTQEVLRETIGRPMTFDEAAIFDLDSSDIDGIEDGIGGAFLQRKKTNEEEE